MLYEILELMIDYKIGLAACHERSQDLVNELKEAKTHLRLIVEAFTAWAEDHNDGEFAYWRSDDLMSRCIAARQYVYGGEA